MIAGHHRVEKISYVLPNKHYIPVNLDYLGLANMTEYVSLSDEQWHYYLTTFA